MVMILPTGIHKQYTLTGHEASVFGLCASGEPSSFYSAAGDGWIVRWDLAGDDPQLGRLVARVDTQVFFLHALPQYNTLIAGNMYGGVHWIDLAAPEQSRNIAAHQGKGVFAILSQGDQVLSAGGDGRLIRWLAPEGRSTESLHLSHHSLRALAYSAQRQELAVGASDRSIYLLDAHTLALRAHLADAHQSSVFALAYSPDGQHLISGGRDAILRIWSLEAPEAPLLLQHQINAHWFTINDLAFSADGRWLASASRDKTIKIWDAHTFQLCKVLDTIRDGCHVNSVNRLLWLPGPSRLISASDDRSIMVWHSDDNTFLTPS